MNNIIHARIRITGQVQGVGFRPFVYRLAHELELTGWVRNDNLGVDITIQGAQSKLMSLIERLRNEAPYLARIEQITHELLSEQGEFMEFNIIPSQDGRQRQTAITPDMAICTDCLFELFDPGDRRYQHPFINCIHCGPRYTLTAKLPYDRANTSMNTFKQCPDCQQEYEMPGTRRFHAQSNSCPACGPTLRLYDKNWQTIVTDDALMSTAGLIRAGKIVAIKGIGGFHLVCDAHSTAVTRLREGKQRDEKPFAVMVLNTTSAKCHAILSSKEIALLESPERPIVLVQSTHELPGIAPGLINIGIMLPYTPLHYLLFSELSPKKTDWLQQESPVVLLMTSANPYGEPLVTSDAEAQYSLTGLADAFLSHDRDILHRCDDSVMRVNVAAPQFIRRARGFTPRHILLPFSGPSVLACGAGLKNTLCITRENKAFVSQHIGDLDHAGTRAMLEETVAHLCEILDIQPELIAHDLHPDFYSSQFAANYAAQHGIPVIAVQHHHAHIAAICAEHRTSLPVLGLALDGVGLGTDGKAWGGELLYVAGARFERIGHLTPIAMPGGDRAAQEPWRMASAALFQLGRGNEIVQRFPKQSGTKTVVTMLQRDLNCPKTSSAGRLFDAAAGLLGLCERQNYEGQAAMFMEGLTIKQGRVEAQNNGYAITENGELDFLPLLNILADCSNKAYGAALFHATLGQGLVALIRRAAQQKNITTIALSGGCLLNSVLSAALIEELTNQGFHVLTAQQLPPNDGGISLGQAWVALQSFNQGA
jgi:hydrogenase maturation protein HypF